ncbi:hypothetical protein [Rhodococcus sp. UNC363MFTsu5.1]|uniref:hypothetical protein n=1 Tax=Rhodococcus sp. UNC363MFTsu5.1 TaxID=1449069 RepID=UPI00048272F2|nr:hypothetical protein [Rhodococcus sp. UNC363MFTsu5.1]
MTDQKTTALHLIALGQLQKMIKAETDGRRGALHSGMDEGDRITVHVEIDGEKVKLGAVIKTDPTTELAVVDRLAHEAWALENMGENHVTEYQFGDSAAVAEVLREHAPHLVTEVRRPSPQWLNEVLVLAGRGEGPVPDGVEPVTGTSVLQVRPNAATVPTTIPELWRRDLLDLGELLAIEDGGA